MTTVYLVRHAKHPLVDHILCGRMPGVGIDASGFAQIRQVIAALSQQPIESVQSSPRLRTRQTAEPIARSLSLPLETIAAFDELDAGEWTGKSFAALARDPRWERWNTQRASARPPAGESMEELRTRVVAHLEGLKGKFNAVAIVSHAEPIRAALMHYHGIPFDRFAEIAIPPASVSILHLTATAPQPAEAELT